MFAEHNYCSMNFVDRITEQERLNKTLGANKSSFIVLYGRRRLGKSTLIKKVLTDKDVYYIADLSESSQQRELLAQSVARVIAGFDQVIYPDWESLFVTLNERTQSRFTLCLDEFPYMVRSAPSLPSLLQKLIDSGKLRFNLIICGSSQQLMYGLVLDGKAPLYGRADQILKLAPIQPRYLQEVLNLSAVDTIREYAVWGGIPRYWELRETENSLYEAIEYLLLSTQGTLYEEPLRLLIDDMKDTVQTTTLLTIIGNGCNRLSEIATRAGKPATNLSRPLEKLITLGYIERELAFGEPEKNSKKSLYRVADPFMNFYYTFIVPNRSLIEFGRSGLVLDMIKRQFDAYTSHYWESFCRKTVSGQTINGITYNTANRWWGSITREQTIEIDLIAESIDKKHLLVGECKWSDKPHMQQTLKELKTKASLLPFAKKHKIIPLLFLKTPPTDIPREQFVLSEDLLSE